MKSTQIVVINWEMILWHKGFIWNSLLYPEKKKKLKEVLSCFGLKFFTIFIVVSSFSLYPHLYSRAYINFRNPDDILLFRDRFDGYIFIDSKGWVIGFLNSSL